jgi:hypothetical protein
MDLILAFARESGADNDVRCREPSNEPRYGVGWMLSVAVALDGDADAAPTSEQQARPQRAPNPDIEWHPDHLHPAAMGNSTRVVRRSIVDDDDRRQGD